MRRKINESIWYNSGALTGGAALLETVVPAQILVPFFDTAASAPASVAVSPSSQVDARGVILWRCETIVRCPGPLVGRLCRGAASVVFLPGSLPAGADAVEKVNVVGGRPPLLPQDGPVVAAFSAMVGCSLWRSRGLAPGPFPSRGGCCHCWAGCGQRGRRRRPRQLPPAYPGVIFSIKLRAIFAKVWAVGFTASTAQPPRQVDSACCLVYFWPHTSSMVSITVGPGSSLLILTSSLCSSRRSVRNKSGFPLFTMWVGSLWLNLSSFSWDISYATTPEKTLIYSKEKMTRIITNYGAEICGCLSTMIMTLLLIILYLYLEPYYSSQSIRNETMYHYFKSNDSNILNTNDTMNAL